ncbi:MAG: protein-export rane protein SecD [Acidimicrobiaceae bacterium]|nr:protein-export rane protein SecD [Acidimicrobiaceae bacterium]
MTRRLVASVVLTCVACFGMLGLAVGLNWSPKLGLDLQGGLSVVFQPARHVDNSTLQEVATIMSLRVNGLGVSGSTIQTQGGNIVVQVPGVKQAASVLKTIGTTAELYFRPVLGGAPAYTGKTGVAYKVPPSPTGPYVYSSSYFNPSTGTYSPPATYAQDPAYASYPSTPASADSTYRNRNVIFSAGSPTSAFAPRYVLGPVQATGTIIKSAFPALQTNGQWVVNFNLTSKGSAIFNKIAAANYQKLLANDLDGQIVSAPSINQSSFNGAVQISGNFNSQSASLLANQLTYGALPVQLRQLDVQTVSPSLGKSSLRAGLFAGLLGLLLVMIYTIIYYRALGIVVVLGLVTTAAFLYGFISLLGVSSLGLTLDLSGVTGLIVSVGITVDSYVVYFERLKDEVRAGRSVRASVDRGFKSAYRTILSADAVSFIGALILWLLSIGNVKGFAFQLGLSTLVDVVTAYTFTRPLVILLGRSRMFTEARHLGVARGLARTTPGAAPGAAA